MATNIEFLDNLPVKFPFTEPDSCLCDTSPFKQLAQFSDTALVVFKPKTSDVSVTNPTFTGSLTGWTAGTGWTYNSNKARLTAGAGDLEQNISHTVGQIYKITFTVSNFSNTPPYGFYLSLGGALYSTQNPTGIQANGTYTVYLTPINSDNLKFGSSSTYVTLDLDDILIEKIEQCYEIGYKKGELAGYNSFYFTRGDGSTLTEGSAINYGIEETIPTGNLSYSVCFDSYNGLLWVGTTNGLTYVSIETNEILGTIAFGSVIGVCFDSYNKRVYASGGSVYSVDAINKTVLSTITVGTTPHELAFDSLNNRIYVCNTASDNVSVIQTSDDTVIATVAVGDTPSGIAFDSINDRMYVTNAVDGTVKVIATASNTVTNTITVGTFPIGIAYDQVNEAMYVCNSSSSTVSVISTASNTVTDTITSLTGAYRIAYDTVFEKMYVTGYGTSNIYLLDCDTVALEDTIASGVTTPLYIVVPTRGGGGIIPTYYKDVAYAMPSWETITGSNIEGCYQLKITDTCSEVDYYSMEYNLKVSHPCTIALSYFGTYNSFGIPYEQFDWVTYPYPISITIRNKYNLIRLQSYLVNSKYPAEVARYIDSGGSQKLYYGSNRKEKTLFIVEVPEYMHDAIATAFIHDNLYNGLERIQWLDSSYDPEWGGDNNYLYLAKSRVQIGKFTDDNKSID
jgi:YVTN family beta-propeller protein